MNLCTVNSLDDKQFNSEQTFVFNVHRDFIQDAMLNNDNTDESMVDDDFVFVNPLNLTRPSLKDNYEYIFSVDDIDITQVEHQAYEQIKRVCITNKWFDWFTT